MAQLSEFLTPLDLQRIGSLQVLARLVVEGYCTGLHRSPHKGSSVEFKQHRQYVPGDDPRYIDWKAYAKTDRVYIREYEEETNLRATMIVDQSGSMGYEGSGGMSKLQYASRLAACLGYLLLQQADAVGLVTFDTKVRKRIPPRSRPGHLRVVLDELQKSRPRGETDLGTVLHDLAELLPRRGMLILISDAFGDVANILSALAHLRHARHEVILLQIWDRDELEFPFRQWTRFDSMEQSGVHHLVDPAMLRRGYMEKLAAFREELTMGCRRHRVDLVPLVTDEPYAEALGKYLATRRRRS
ncbi:MAG: DUF58 domain-containing protein [Phycisphaeraceae bacterium]|nr:DUF58 domain-containing protein [Phycisphaeraceae bacterium]